MGDGGCAVLSSRHPLAEFCNSEHCHREQLRNTWDTEFGLVTVKESDLNVSAYHEERFTWTCVGDMDPGSDFQVSDDVGEATRSENSRLNERVSEITKEGPAPESTATTGPFIINNESQEIAHNESPQQVTEEKAGTLASESEQFSFDNASVKVVHGGLGVDDEASHAKEQCREEDASFGLENSYPGDQLYLESNQSIGDNESSCTQSRQEHNMENASFDKSPLSVVPKSGASSIPTHKEHSHSRSERVVRSDKLDRPLEHLPIVHRKGVSHSYHGRNESLARTREHSLGKREVKEKKTGDQDLNYNSPRHREHSVNYDFHGSKRDYKDKRNDRESSYSSSRPGCKGKENGDGSGRGNPATNNRGVRDHYTDKDIQINRVYHKRSHDNKSSSTHEECHKNSNDSDREMHRSSTSTKNDPLSRGKEHPDEVVGVADRNGCHGSPAETKNICDKVNADHPEQQVKLESKVSDAEAEMYLTHQNNVSANLQKDGLFTEEMDVPMDMSPEPMDLSPEPMDLSPAPAEDNKPSSSVAWVAPEFGEKQDCEGWVYLDAYGVMQGPMPLDILKTMMVSGKLQSDHMVQLVGSNEWFTLEHAGLALSVLDLKPTKSNRIDGNTEVLHEALTEENIKFEDEDFITGSLNHNLEIDERVEQIMQGFTLVQGKEKEVVVEALIKATKRLHLNKQQEQNDEDSLPIHIGLASYWNSNQIEVAEGYDCLKCDRSISSDNNEATERLSGINQLTNFPGIFQSSRNWTARGGDWKLTQNVENTENTRNATHSTRPEKTVLNRGIPLCQKCQPNPVDPRRGSHLYDVPVSRTLELPTWAYRYWDVKGESLNATTESGNAAPTPPIAQVSTPRGLNTDGSKKFKVTKVAPLSEQKPENPGEIAPDMSGYVPANSLGGYCEKDASHEAFSQTMAYHELECPNVQSAETDLSLPVENEVTDDLQKMVQRVPTKEDLRLDTGDWFYRDGTGQEIGPFTYSQLQAKAETGLLFTGASVYRKSDQTWVPLVVDKNSLSSSARLEEGVTIEEYNGLQMFHEIYPQFIGYMCGKLHEHVMKSYKARDFSAMLSSFGDRKSRRVGTGDATSHAQLEASSRQNDRSPSNLDANSDMDFIENSVRRTRSLLDLDARRVEENISWGFLSPRLLVRVFRFLETDIKSLVLASATCRTWKASAVQFKREITQIDLSPLGRHCSDDMFRSFTEHACNVSRIILRGCTTLSLSVVKTFLESLHSVESIDVKGCNQLKELQMSFTKYQSSRSTKVLVDRKNMSASKHTKTLDAPSLDDWKARRLSFSSMHSDGTTEAMDCDTPHSSQRNSEISRSSDSTKRFKSQSSGKVVKPNAEISHFKVSGSYSKDSEYKQKQNSLLSSVSEVNSQLWIRGDCSSGPDKKLEKDMAFVLQCLKDAKIPDNRKLSSSGSSGSRALAYREIEDKLRRGLYPPNMQGFRAFKGDLLSVARMLFRGKDKQAGMVVFGNTFRLTSQLEEEFKCRDMSFSRPHKRKYQDYKSSSPLPGKKRKVVSGTMKQSFDRKRTSYDDSSDDEEHDFDLTYKSDTSATDEEDDVSSQCDEDSVSDSDTDSDESDSEVESESEKEDKILDEKEPLSEDETDSRIWGARMTKASMVPPVTRKYELIEEYVIVADEEEVRKRMEVRLPDDYEQIVRAQEDNGIEFSHLIMPELREYRPRKCVQDEVLEQEVYGIDPYTHNLLIDSMPTNRPDFSDERKHEVIEEDILKALNQEVRQYTGTAKAPTKYPLELAVNRALEDCKDFSKRTFISALAKNMRARRESNMRDNYVAYRKGLGVVCNEPCGFTKDEFIVEFFGEVYPAWRWFEKQDAIRAFQKKDKEGAPEFYNIFLERPKGDANGYDLVVVDAMHKANYASRICHSCNPNCEARVTAVNGKYQIGVYTLRNVEYGEELSFDYNSITESKEEHETSVCLCGSHICRGSYLNFAGPDTFQEIMKADHGVLHRHDLLLHACTTGGVTSEDRDVLKQACLGSCLLGGLPEWTVKYAAGVMRFLNEERQSLPREILKTILSERKLDKAGEQEAFEAEVQADGVFNTRLQNLAITLDKVRYVLKKLYGDPKAAPPPLRKLEPPEVIRMVWTDDNSVVADLLNSMSPHISKEAMSEFRRKVQEHEPSERGDLMYNLRKSLLWLRDELCKAPITCVTRHDAAADLIHIYAHTKLFFTRQDYEAFDSPSLRISPLDLGPKHAHKLAGAPFKEWTKTYSKDYVLGQLIFWYKLNESEPGTSLTKASRGCVVLPDPSSCYAKSMQHRLVYGSIDRLKMFRRMEHKPQRPWNWKGQYFWEFNHDRRLIGSPMMDALHEGTNVNKEMMDWLKKRTRAFEGQWDIE